MSSGTYRDKERDESLRTKGLHHSWEPLPLSSCNPMNDFLECFWVQPCVPAHHVLGIATNSRLKDFSNVGKGHKKQGSVRTSGSDPGPTSQCLAKGTVPLLL